MKGTLYRTAIRIKELGARHNKLFMYRFGMWMKDKV